MSTYLSFMLLFIHTLLINNIQAISIDILSLQPCNNQDYSILIHDLTIQYENGHVAVSGTLVTDQDLNAPIKAEVKVEKDELGIWIPIPCVDQIGSCTYEDLCIHSIPQNISCPQEFVDNEIPCRCPIPKGTYKIPPQIKIPLHVFNKNALKSITSGKYYIKSNIQRGSTVLTCYEAYVFIKDDITKELDNEIRPIIILNK